MLALAATAAVPVVLAGTTELTVYRITPRNYSGVVNLDTGDAAGDAFFGLYEKQAPVVCASSASRQSSSLICSNDPLLQIPGFNVYIQVKLEVDERFGRYSKCNPSHYPPHNFVCEVEREGCWYNDYEHPEWAQEFADACDRQECECEAVDRASVGREYPHFGAPVPPGTPDQCADNYYTLQHYANENTGTIIDTLKNVSQGDCCSSCTTRNTPDHTTCGSYVFTPEFLEHGRGKCVLHGRTSFQDLGPSLTATTGYFSGLGLAAFVQKAAGELSDTMNGTWYSTQEEGQCKSNQTLGKDCWWRVVKQTAQVNATCVNDHMIEKVMAQRPHCTDKCPDPTNQDSPCYIGCLYETLVGNHSASPPVPATSRELILNAFESAFTGPTACSAVPDCPDPCLPPCWGVPEGQPCEHNATSYY